MASLVRSIVGIVGCFSIVHSVRFRRKGKPVVQVEGVPARNYQEKVQDWIILFHPNVTDEGIERICKGDCDLKGHPSKGGVPFARIIGRDVMRMRLRESHEGVELVEPNEEDSAIPELADMGASRLASWGLEAVGVEERPGTGSGVHIYVQDTGVRVSHADFGGRALSELDFSSGKMVECNGNSGCATDTAGHGTHCAGTAGGKEYGVASGATIHAIKTLRDSGVGERAWNIASIDWIISSGKRPAVISLSLGGEGQDPSYSAAIKAATAAGVVVVVAAGNFGSDSCTYSPAFVPEAITVGGTNGDTRAGYSNYGTCNNIMAPGTAIESASNLADTMQARLTGTSMACPHVSGAVAILLGRNPWWGREQVMGHLDSFGRKGWLKKLKPGDPDLFLWVGANPAPGDPECPAFATRPEPSYWGDCSCPSDKFCSLDGQVPNCPSSMGPGGWGGAQFSWNCTECRCY